MRRPADTPLALQHAISLWRAALRLAPDGLYAEQYRRALADAEARLAAIMKRSR